MYQNGGIMRKQQHIDVAAASKYQHGAKMARNGVCHCLYCNRAIMTHISKSSASKWRGEEQEKRGV